MRLIDADALIEAHYQHCNEHHGDTDIFYVWSLKLMQNAPTIDAVPVVLCKDCKWWTKQEASIQGRCALAGIYPTGGWYCGNGKREDNE